MTILEIINLIVDFWTPLWYLKSKTEYLFLHMIRKVWGFWEYLQNISAFCSTTSWYLFSQNIRCFALSAHGEAQTGARLNHDQLLFVTEPRQEKGAGLEETWHDSIHSRKKLDQTVKIITWLMIMSVSFRCFPLEALALIVLLAYGIQETFPTCTSTPRRCGGVLIHLQTTDTNIHEVQRVPQSVYTGL